MAPAAGGPSDLTSRLQAAWQRGVLTAAPLWPYYLIMSAVGLFHLFEVHVLDPAASAFIQGVLGSSVEVFAGLEAPLYASLDAVWTPGHVSGVTAYYLVGFLTLLVWTPHLVALSGDRARLKRVLLTYPLLYLLALPGYLLLPQLNPYIALGLADPFSMLQPGLEESYYLFTTTDNTFPSLHVGFTVALTWHLVRGCSELVGGAAVVHGVLLVASVVYLRVHWIGDVVGGVLVAWAALWLAGQAARREGPLAGTVARLDRIGRRGALRASSRLRQGR